MSPFVEAARQVAFGLRQSRPSALSHGPRDLSWRHHGLGMLQAELSEELRVHVWHPSLVDPGMEWPRCVHDHRFDLRSAVVIGEVIDVPCRVAECPEPMLVSLSGGAQYVHVYEIEHAKTQDRMVKREGCSTATSARRLYRAFVEALPVERHRAGEEYGVTRRVFHTTRVEALAVTVVHRSDFDDRLARVLCAVGKEVSAVGGIVRDSSPEHERLVAGVLDQAAAALCLTVPADRKPYSSAPCSKCGAFRVVCTLEDEPDGCGTYYEIECEACGHSYRTDGPDA